MNRATGVLLALLEFVRGLAGIAVTLALFAAAGALVVMGLMGTAPKPVKVPALQGLPATDAQKVASATGLQLKVTGREFDPNIGQDRVISTKPYEGKRVKRGRVVECTVSKGPRSVLMPKVEGLTLPAAESRLGEKGLGIGDVRRKASDVPVDEVLSQDPEAGSQVERGHGIVLTVSGGRDFGRIVDPDGTTWLYRRVRVAVPRGAPLQRVQVILHDSDGNDDTVYDRVHRPGDAVSVDLIGRSGWRVEVLVTDKQVFSERL
ncbi:MAG: PASTA domain-containing protein [Armatimonadia bacterium]